MLAPPDISGPPAPELPGASPPTKVIMQYSPTDYFARVGYAHVAARVPDAPNPDDHMRLLAEWTDARVLDYLRGPPETWPPDDAAKKRAKAAKLAEKARLKRATSASVATMPAEPEPAPAVPEVKDAREQIQSLCGASIRWHIDHPRLKLWAGHMTLESIIETFRRAICYRPLPAETRLLDWVVPVPFMTGLDSRTAVKALDIGWSPDTLDMSVSAYAAAELLQIIGMQVSPLTRVERDYYVRDALNQWWRFAVETRVRYYRRLTWLTACDDPYRGRTVDIAKKWY